jgi:hypothetical protein
MRAAAHHDLRRVSREPLEQPRAQRRIRAPGHWLVGVRVASRRVPIHPDAVKSSRSRDSAAQARTDLGDAYLLADLLRTDGHPFPVLAPPSGRSTGIAIRWIAARYPAAAAAARRRAVSTTISRSVRRSRPAASAIRYPVRRIS